MKIRRGDIFLADLNPVRGTEQAGVRPVLIVQCNLANARIPTVTVVPLTSKLRAKRFLFTVFVSAEESGLSKDSIVLVFHIRTLDKSRLIHKMGSLSPHTMTTVDEALLLHLGLQPASA